MIETIEDFNRLDAELKNLVKAIPLHWGQVQNNSTDSQINMFAIKTYNELESIIANFSDDKKNYFKRRWFLWQCSKCDEFLFCLNNNVQPNPSKKDKAYDIEFNNNTALQFDIKGTVIPKQFRANVNDIIMNPKPMINFFYEQQSKGVREGYQNRLFIVHHSYRLQAREMYLRCHFNFKKEAFKQYAAGIGVSSNFITYQNAIADIIFIIENLDKSIVYKVASAK